MTKETPTIALYYEWTTPAWIGLKGFEFSEHDFSFIKGDELARLVKLCNEELGEGEGQYSPEQVRKAAWEFLKEEINQLRENLVSRFIEQYSGDRYRLLGDPEIAQDKEDG